MNFSEEDDTGVLDRLRFVFAPEASRHPIVLAAFVLAASPSVSLSFQSTDFAFTMFSRAVRPAVKAGSAVVSR